MIAKKLLISAALLWGAAYSYACTSIIVSGKVTPDGRPYIFKNRDTHDQNNLARLINRSGTGILQKIEPIETEIIRRAASLRQSNKPDNDIAEFYRWVEKYITEQYGLLLHR